MNGLIRLVNPWRGVVYTAEVETGCGRFLSARTEDFKSFSVYCVYSGREFYAGRRFSRAELAQWFAGAAIHPDERRVIADELGEIPAVAPNPQSWVWYCVAGRGEERLRDQYKPTLADLQLLAGEALRLNNETFLPLLDPFEIWVRDKYSGLPLALVMTARTLEEADWITFGPLWRANWSTATQKNEVALRQLQKQVNERINASDTPGRVRYTHSIFRRNLDNRIEEYGREKPFDPLVLIQSHPPCYLPSGQLAEPFESIRQELEGHIRL